MLARGRAVRQSKLLFYAKMAEKALQVCSWHVCCPVTTAHVRACTYACQDLQPLLALQHMCIYACMQR